MGGEYPKKHPQIVELTPSNHHSSGSKTVGQWSKTMGCSSCSPVFVFIVLTSWAWIYWFLLGDRNIFVSSDYVCSWVPRVWAISHQLSMSDWTTPPVPGTITLGIGFSGCYPPIKIHLGGWPSVGNAFPGPPCHYAQFSFPFLSFSQHLLDIYPS